MAKYDDLSGVFHRLIPTALQFRFECPASDEFLDIPRFAPDHLTADRGARGKEAVEPRLWRKGRGQSHGRTLIRFW